MIYFTYTVTDIETVEKIRKTAPNVKYAWGVEVVCASIGSRLYLDIFLSNGYVFSLLTIWLRTALRSSPKHKENGTGSGLSIPDVA